MYPHAACTMSPLGHSSRMVPDSKLAMMVILCRYVTEGLDIMTKLQSGDVIVSAKVVAGSENLVRNSAA